MSSNNNKLREFDNFAIDGEKKVLWFENEPVEMSVKAVELLFVLIENRGEVVSKEELLNKVWQDSFVEESVLSQNVYLLRKVFKEKGLEGDLIQTVPRRGYRFTGELNGAVEEEISIERSTFERKYIAEAEVLTDLNEIENENALEVPVDTQESSAPQNKITNTNRLPLYLLILLVSFFAIGWTIWFWNNSTLEEDKNKVKLLIDNDSLKFNQLTESGRAMFPAISRDNQNLAYVAFEKDGYSIVLRHLASNSETKIIENSKIKFDSLHFSADGNYLYFMQRVKKYPESTVYQIPLYGGSKRRIISNVNDMFSISPDGERLAFLRYNPKTDEISLMTANIDGSNEKIISSRKSPNSYRVWGVHPAWSPDGRKIALPVDKESSETTEQKAGIIVEIDLETGEETKIKSPKWDSVSQIHWMADGNGFYVLAQEKRNQPKQIWYLSYPVGEAKRITNDTISYGQIYPSFDSKTIYTTKAIHSGNLYTVSLDDPENVRQLTSGDTKLNGYEGLDFSNDGKELFFIKSEGYLSGNLWKINLETLKEEQLTFDKYAYMFSVKVHPNEDAVYFSSDRTGVWHIWKVDLDGGNLQQVTNGKGEGDVEISPDGKWLFYSSPAIKTNELWKKPLDGGEAVKVLIGAKGVSKVSPVNSDQIVAYYYDRNENERPWKYVLFSHEVKNELQDLDFETTNHAIEWSKDGKGIFYIERNLYLNNVIYLSIEDKKTRKFTNFTEQRINNLNISPDGKQLAISRGSRTYNILQISGVKE